MGMKSKVRSMQRGAYLRLDVGRVSNADLYRQGPPLLTDDELVHFKFGDRSINDSFLGLSDVLLACHRNHLPAAHVAKILNKMRARTACGEQWTPRLAWFLMTTWRTIHFRSQALKRRQRQVSAQNKVSRANEYVDNGRIEDPDQQQEALPSKKKPDSHFKNPTLGEVSAELVALNDALRSRRDETGLACNATSKEQAKPDQTKPTSCAVSYSKQSTLSPMPQYAGRWQLFFEGVEGRKYLADLVRTHPEILAMATVSKIGFLVFLRSRKVRHPFGRNWVALDSKCVQSAIFASLYVDGNRE